MILVAFMAGLIGGAMFTWMILEYTSEVARKAQRDAERNKR